MMLAHHDTHKPQGWCWDCTITGSEVLDFMIGAGAGAVLVLVVIIAVVRWLDR